jgi:hypothetical protein
MRNNINRKDFKNAMNFLKDMAKDKNLYFEISNCRWIKPISLYLSTKNKCFNFWKYTCKEGDLGKICKCKTINDICYTPMSFLFTWYHTDEGDMFWRDLLCEDLCTFSNSTIFTPLCEVCNNINKKLKYND